MNCFQDDLNQEKQEEIIIINPKLKCIFFSHFLMFHLCHHHQRNTVNVQYFP